MLKLKLKPSQQQAKLLLETIQEANAACNLISERAWERKVFSQFKRHKQVYYPIKSDFRLSSQMIVRCISKVADAYKLDKKSMRTFRPLGSLAYDSRILSYNTVKQVASVWTLTGREKIPFVCYQTHYLPYMQGEADLAYIRGKFYLLQTIDIPSEQEVSVEEFLGVDMGITDIATLSTGQTFASQALNQYKIKRQKVRSSLQSKCTKNAKRVLKRLSSKEKRTQLLINHTLAKRIVAIAKEQGKGIVVENLKSLRKSFDKFSKPQRGFYNKWGFYDLRCKIEYKAKRQGVPVVIVDPRYSSKMCHCCKHMGHRKSKQFKCINCGLALDADDNAALNLATMGSIVNTPENSIRLTCELGLNLPPTFSRSGSYRL